MTISFPCTALDYGFILPVFKSGIWFLTYRFSLLLNIYPLKDPGCGFSQPVFCWLRIHNAVRNLPLPFVISCKSAIASRSLVRICFNCFGKTIGGGVCGFIRRPIASSSLSFFMLTANNAKCLHPLIHWRLPMLIISFSFNTVFVFIFIFKGCFPSPLIWLSSGTIHKIQSVIGLILSCIF